MPGSDPLERRLRLSGILLILGLLVEALCLAWKGPLAFLVFAGLGGLLFLAGMVVYLLSLVSVGHHQE
jgi:hypothetical protein